MLIYIKNFLKKIIKGYLRDIYWDIYGKNIRNPACIVNPKSFLFICKGNICRSPFAEYIAKQILDNASKEKEIFYSAGLDVSQPLPSPKEAVLAAESFDVQLDSHRSRRINQNMIESFDMIIAMETWQFNNLKKSFPDFHKKICLLPLFDSRVNKSKGGFYRYNIQDPYGRNVDIFNACFQRIKECIRKMIEECNIIS